MEENDVRASRLQPHSLSNVERRPSREHGKEQERRQKRAESVERETRDHGRRCGHDVGSEQQTVNLSHMVHTPPSCHSGSIQHEHAAIVETRKAGEDQQGRQAADKERDASQNRCLRKKIQTDHRRREPPVEDPSHGIGYRKHRHCHDARGWITGRTKIFQVCIHGKAGGETGDHGGKELPELDAPH
jgi:hypothetical protein